MNKILTLCDQPQLKILEIRGVGPLDNNIFVVIDPPTREAIIVDACTEADLIIETCRQNEVKPVMIATTHGHGDHIGAVEGVRSEFDIPFLIHPNDHFLLDQGGGKLSPEPNQPIVPGKELIVGGVALHPILTPGHTPGSVCFVTEPYLFSGDTLFPGGPGATHWEYSDFGQIMDSIEQEIFRYPDPTLVYPGHGADTTLEQERPQLGSWRKRGW